MSTRLTRSSFDEGRSDVADGGNFLLILQISLQLLKLSIVLRGSSAAIAAPQLQNCEHNSAQHKAGSQEDQKYI